MTGRICHISLWINHNQLYSDTVVIHDIQNIVLEAVDNVSLADRCIRHTDYEHIDRIGIRLSRVVLLGSSDRSYLYPRMGLHNNADPHLYLAQRMLEVRDNIFDHLDNHHQKRCISDSHLFHIAFLASNLDSCSASQPVQEVTTDPGRIP